MTDETQELTEEDKRWLEELESALIGSGPLTRSPVQGEPMAVEDE